MPKRKKKTYLDHSQTMARVSLSRVKELEKRLVAAEEVIIELLVWAIANRGSEHEFVRCYTYPHGKAPSAILKAQKFLGDKTSLKLYRSK